MMMMMMMVIFIIVAECTPVCMCRVCFDCLPPFTLPTIFGALDLCITGCCCHESQPKIRSWLFCSSVRWYVICVCACVCRVAFLKLRYLFLSLSLSRFIFWLIILRPHNGSHIISRAIWWPLMSRNITRLAVKDLRQSTLRADLVSRTGDT